MVYFSFARQTSPSQSADEPEEYIHTIKPEGKLMIDSGTTIMFLSDILASSINSLFRPAPSYDATIRTYFVRCDATPPRVGLTIGGTTG